jgi:hypothetical protein
VASRPFAGLIEKIMSTYAEYLLSNRSHRGLRGDDPVSAIGGMPPGSDTRMMNLVGMIVAAGLALPAGLGASLAAEQSAEDIIRALRLTSITRSLTAADAAGRAEETHFLNSLRNRPAHSLTNAEREQLLSIIEGRSSTTTPPTDERP